MASVAAPRFPSPSTPHTDPNPSKFPSKSPRLLATSTRHSLRLFMKTTPIASASRASDSLRCRCRNPRSDAPSPSDDDSANRRWDSMLQDVVRTAVKRWDDYVKSFRNSWATDKEQEEEVREKGEEKKEKEKVAVDWDWERWKRHFDEMEEQERIVYILKSQLDDAVSREDYEDAAKLKIAIAAAAANDTVGGAISHFNKAVEEEQYRDAAFIRDHAGAGLVGWWAGISEDSADPYGRIIHITAEHGRYVARSYSSRQLATGKSGFPLFEIYFTVGHDGEYKHQAVYLKRKSGEDFLKKLSKPSSLSNLNPLSGSIEGKNDLSVKSPESLEDKEERDDDPDGLADIQNVLRDMIPGVKVKVLKVVSPGKVNRDLISKVIEQIIEDEDDEKDIELESVEPEDEVKTESDIEEIEMDAGDATSDAGEEQSELSVKVVIGGIMQKMSADIPPKDMVRVPAKLEKRGRFSFSFSMKQDDGQQDAAGKGHALRDKGASRRAQRSPDLIMSDLAKVLISREKIPLKVLKDVGELVSLTFNQDQNHKPLYGTTLFNRIEIPTTSDPLSGLYVSAHGMFNSEVLHLRHKFGQWQEDGMTQKPVGLEFYEYVEAFKLTGDLSVPAGQVTFRAKVGKQYQLPHKGIIPEEFGVIARYKGQGRVADPGFRNPRWVDGELVILDGKYIRGGPVIGFVYWAPEYHFLVFFNRLRLQN